MAKTGYYGEGKGTARKPQGGFRFSHHGQQQGPRAHIRQAAAGAAVHHAERPGRELGVRRRRALLYRRPADGLVSLWGIEEQTVLRRFACGREVPGRTRFGTERETVTETMVFGGTLRMSGRRYDRGGITSSRPCRMICEPARPCYLFIVTSSSSLFRVCSMCFIISSMASTEFMSAR